MTDNATVQTVLPLLRQEMGKMKIPRPADKVHKDECMYSFDSPFSSPDGLFVNLVTYQGFGKNYLHQDKSTPASSNKIYLQEKWRQVPAAKTTPTATTTTTSDVNDGQEAPPTKLAIGVSGGFVTEQEFDIVKEHFLYVVAGNGGIAYSLALPNQDIPEFVSNVIQGIIDHAGMKSNMQASSWEAENEKFVSKYANDLVQINPTGKKISQDPNSWVDEATGETGNLWLNLATGYIGGGRKNWDGSGGSGSALQHYQDTGKQYPLSVKLGTITPHGADVWSYADDEDNLVIDPKLAEHLSFWGIDIMKLEKTDKTLGEMEVDLNMSYDWSRIMEGGEQLEPKHGAGFVGLTNIGSSCYLNSIMQCVLTLSEVQQRYLARHDEIIASAPSDASTDFMAQLSKLAVALGTDRYVPTAEEFAAAAQAAAQEKESNKATGVVVEPARNERYNIAPRMFKFLVAKGHAEFSSSRQQDASEYFMHLLDVMGKSERGAGLARLGASKPTGSIFEFHLQNRIHDPVHNWVRYSKIGQNTLSTVLELRIPLEKGVEDIVSAADASASAPAKLAATEGDAKDAKRARVDTAAAPSGANTTVNFQHCLDTALEAETVDIALGGSAAGGNVACTKTTRFRTFPRYLMVKLGRYYAGPNWVQVKINAKVPVPEHLDLSTYRSNGLQADEVLAPEDPAGGAGAGTADAAAPVEPNEELVMQLITMGFSENGCRRAAVATNNADMETAMNWVLEHMEDADFYEPLPPAGAASAASSAGAGAGGEEVPAEAMMMLTSMGYTERQVQGAMRATDNNIERAADWLFSHMDDLDGSVEVVLSESSASATGGASAGAAGEETALAAADDGEGKYSLMAVISHIGKNTDHGHYVCHIKKNEEWVLFNDEKVGKSAGAPLEHGFMYLFKRDDGNGSLA